MPLPNKILIYQVLGCIALSRIKACTCSIVQKDDLPILIVLGNSPFWTISQNFDFETGIISRICGIRINVIDGVCSLELLMAISLTGALHILSITLQSHLCRTHLCVTVWTIQTVKPNCYHQIVLHLVLLCMNMCATEEQCSQWNFDGQSKVNTHFLHTNYFCLTKKYLLI